MWYLTYLLQTAVRSRFQGKQIVMILSISDMLKRIHGSNNPSLWLFIILFTFAAILYHAHYGTIFERESLAEGSLIHNVFLTYDVKKYNHT